ncbi:MAG: Gfo/Idh/MocA family oxidoreductase [Armatimonadetes bacterium]|nr:Gfo/Idh/MocA family oxidoreductase [Armatimonadota bacterium]
MVKGMKEIRCAVIGYGMGKFHSEQIEQTNAMKLVAICDVNSKRLEEAKRDFPQINTYQSVEDLLAHEDFELAVIVTPHNTHAPLTLKCLKAGKHVIVEKPMCITVKEAKAMIETAKQKGLMLTVYHNRHWDGDFLALREILQSGLIGEIFHVEMFGGGYHKPSWAWRSDKKASGGLFYDWGAHYLWWLLQIIPHEIQSVTGSFHKIKWQDVSIEDHVQAFIRFANGAIADVQFSTISAETKPRWFILGTDGAIVSEENQFRIKFFVNGNPAETKIPYRQSNWHEFYRNIANHLLHGEELAIKPEQAMKVIAVMEYAERSAKSGGKALSLPQ